MKFIEMTGQTLEQIINDGELHSEDLSGAGVSKDSIIRVNQHGDIEVRRAKKWDVVGGLLGNFEERLLNNIGNSKLDSISYESCFHQLQKKWLILHKLNALLRRRR